MIPRIKALHAIIAETIITNERMLSGAQVRFLRKHLGLSGAHFAARMGVARETVSRWENEKGPLGPTADRLVRYLVAHQKRLHSYGAEPANQAGDAAPMKRIEAKLSRGDWTACVAA